MEVLFSIAAGLTLLLGVAWLFVPKAMLSWWGAEPNDAAAYMARRYGGLFLGYAVILWLSRYAMASPARTAILAGGAVVSTVMMVVSLIGLRSRVVGRIVGIAAVVETALAAAFVYFYLTAR